MSQYVTNTSDRRKGKALLCWFIGAFGVLGFENFYVGKIKNGLIHFFVGLIVSILIISLVYGIVVHPEDLNWELPTAIAFWAIAALPNLCKILIGTFRDNIGNALRE